MKTALISAARILLGSVFFIFGLNVFLHFIPMPPMQGAAAQLMGGLAAGGYFFPLLGLTETLAGGALLTRRFVPLALTVLAPLIVNIVAIHSFLAPSGLPFAIVLLGLELFLACVYRAAFVPLLRARDDQTWATSRTVSSIAR